MSVSDPLIKDLKGTLLSIIQSGEGKVVVTDENEHLVPFCTTLERIFLKGLQVQTPHSCGNFVAEPWDWLNAVGHAMEGGTVERNFAYLRSLEPVRECRKVTTSTGRFRLLVRSCLVNKCLHVPVMVLKRSMAGGGRRWYSQQGSVLGSDILAEILLSALCQLALPSLLQFDLRLPNSRFLDTTWSLPALLRLDCVPCDSLGLSLCFVGDLAVVVGVDPCSVAAEDDKVVVGDVVDELNGVVLTAQLRGKLGRLKRGSRHGPLAVLLVKARGLTGQGELFPPLASALRAANVAVQDLLPSSAAPRGAGDVLLYLGCAPLGPHGDVKQLDRGLRAVLTQGAPPRKVRLECEELGLRVLDEERKALVHHTYMEVSACGQVSTLPRHFAYIAGNDVCNIASQFTCHVFQAGSEDTCQAALLSIGQGFQRTHFAV